MIRKAPLDCRSISPSAGSSIRVPHPPGRLRFCGFSHGFCVLQGDSICSAPLNDKLLKMREILPFLSSRAAFHLLRYPLGIHRISHRLEYLSCPADPNKLKPINSTILLSISISPSAVPQLLDLFLLLNPEVPHALALPCYLSST